MSLIINNHEEQRFNLATLLLLIYWTVDQFFMVCRKSDEAIFTNENHCHFQRNKHFVFFYQIVVFNIARHQTKS